MGLYAGLPYGVAPGMGINAFFAFSLVKEMGISWQTALGAVFISGVIFMFLSVTGVRTEIVKAIPKSIRFGMAAGIGVFLSLIGFKSVDFIVHSEATLVAFGGLNLTVILFLAGLTFTSVLVVKNMKGAFTAGILLTSALTLVISLIGTSAGWLPKPLLTMPDEIFSLPSMEVFLKLDIVDAFKFGMIVPVFSLLFVDMFDSIATFVGVAEVAGLVDREGIPKNIGKALLMDAFSTTISGLFGTSSGTVYVESAAGIKEGGRTGLTAVITGLLFLPFMFLSPLVSFIPSVATAPVLVLVGVFMTQPLASIDWKSSEEAIPAFLSFVLIPLTFSITQGVIWSFLAYTVIKIFTGKAGEVHPMLYIVDAFAVFSLVAPVLSK
jgi:AGZA family xanthine/uracil permease-like MFS transporter